MRPLAALLFGLAIIDGLDVLAEERLQQWPRVRDPLWVGQGYWLGGLAARWWGSPARWWWYALAFAVSVAAAWVVTPRLAEWAATRASGALYLGPIAYATIWVVRGLRTKGVELTPERLVAGLLLACDMVSLLVVWGAGAKRFYPAATLATAIVHAFLGWRILRWNAARSANG